MLSPVVAPKPRRLSSPKAETTQDAVISREREYFFCTPESREVEEIMIKLDEVDAEREQKSPTSSEGARPLGDSEEVQEYSPPLRVISPPARTANPQAAAVEAYYSSDEWAPENPGLDAPPLRRAFTQQPSHVEYISDDEELVESTVVHPPLFSAYSAPTTPYRSDDGEGDYFEREGEHTLDQGDEDEEGVFAYYSIYSRPLDIPSPSPRAKGSLFGQIRNLGTSPTKRKREPASAKSLPSEVALSSLEATCVLSRAVSLPLETSQRQKKEAGMAYECASGLLLLGKMRCHSSVA